MDKISPNTATSYLIHMPDTSSLSLKWSHVYLILPELAKSCLTSASFTKLQNS